MLTSVKTNNIDLMSSIPSVFELEAFHFLVYDYGLKFSNFRLLSLTNYLKLNTSDELKLFYFPNVYKYIYDKDFPTS